MTVMTREPPPTTRSPRYCVPAPGAWILGCSEHHNVACSAIRRHLRRRHDLHQLTDQRDDHAVSGCRGAVRRHRDVGSRQPRSPSRPDTGCSAHCRSRPPPARRRSAGTRRWPRILRRYARRAASPWPTRPPTGWSARPRRRARSCLGGSRRRSWRSGVPIPATSPGDDQQPRRHCQLGSDDADQDGGEEMAREGGAAPGPLHRRGGGEQRRPVITGALCEILPGHRPGATWSRRDALFTGRRSGKGMMNAPRDLPIHRPEIQPDRRHTGRWRELNIETAPSKPTVKV